MSRHGIVVIPLHRRAFARHHSGTYAVARGLVATRKAMAGGKVDRPHAPARIRALRIRDAGMGARGILGFGGAIVQLVSVAFVDIEQIEVVHHRREEIGVGQPAIRIFWRHPSHRYGPFDEFVEGCRRGIRGRDDGLPLADEDAESHIAGLGSLEVFPFSQSLRHAQGNAAHPQGVRGVGAQHQRLPDQIVQQFGSGFFEWRGRRGGFGHLQKGYIGSGDCRATLGWARSHCAPNPRGGGFRMSAAEASGLTTITSRWVYRHRATPVSAISPLPGR